MIGNTNTKIQFQFAGEQQQQEQQQPQQEKQVEQLVIKGVKVVPATGAEWFSAQSPCNPTGIQQVDGLFVESEIQKLQNEIYNLEKGLVCQQQQGQQWFQEQPQQQQWFQGQQGQQQPQQQRGQQQQGQQQPQQQRGQQQQGQQWFQGQQGQQQPQHQPQQWFQGQQGQQQQQQQGQLEQTTFGWLNGLLNKWNGNANGQVWQPKLAKVEQIITEKIKIEQAQRRLDQLCLLAQLKSCERHIVNVQKREPEIHSYLLKIKMQAKIAVFEQKVNQVVKMNPTGVSTPVEQYVRKYEQLLREKIQLDMEKRRVVLHQLRQTVRDCERKLREIQTESQEGQFDLTRMYKNQPELESNKDFETVVGWFLFEQEKKTLQAVQAQRELTFLINEVCGKLQELEFESGCYSSLRIPRISTGLMQFNSHPRLYEIVQLEKKIAEQKLRLKLQTLTGVPTRFVEQLARGVWFTPVVEKLRTIQLNLNTETIRNGEHRFWAEKKTNVVSQLIQTFAQLQTETAFVGQQSLTGLFEQINKRQVLALLRELKERECLDIQTYGQRYATFLYFDIFCFQKKFYLHQFNFTNK
jgi:hypothetical protein